jgi:chaperonin GroES
MALNIKPLSDRVYRTCCWNKNCFRILFQIQQKPQKEPVGNGTKEHTMTVKIGDSVLYGKYAGTELKLEEKIIWSCVKTIF